VGECQRGDPLVRPGEERGFERAGEVFERHKFHVAAVVFGAHEFA